MNQQDLRLETHQAQNVINTVVWHKEIVDPWINKCTPPELLVLSTYFLATLCERYPQMYAQFVRVFTFYELLMKDSYLRGGVPRFDDKGRINFLYLTPDEPLTERPDLICLFDGERPIVTSDELPTVLM
jgi:hypothetical protein